VGQYAFEEQRVMSHCRWRPVKTFFPNPFEIVWCVKEAIGGADDEEESVVPESMAAAAVENQVVEEGGFRLVENHFQGMGMGVVLVVLAIVVIYGMYKCCIRCACCSGKGKERKEGDGASGETTVVINNDDGREAAPMASAPPAYAYGPAAATAGVWTCPAGPAPVAAWQQQPTAWQLPAQLVAPPPTPVGGERARRSPSPSRLPRRQERGASTTSGASHWSVLGLSDGDAWGASTTEGLCTTATSTGETSCGNDSSRGSRRRRRARETRRKRRARKEEERRHKESTPSERYYQLTIERERARQHALVTRANHHAGESRWQALKELEQLRGKRLLMVDYPPMQEEPGVAEERARVRAVEKERERQNSLVHAARYRSGERSRRAREELGRLRAGGQLLVEWPTSQEEREEERARDALACTYGDEEAGQIMGRVADAGLGLSVNDDATGQ